MLTFCTWCGWCSEHKEQLNKNVLRSHVRLVWPFLPRAIVQHSSAETLVADNAEKMPLQGSYLHPSVVSWLAWRFTSYTRDLYAWPVFVPQDHTLEMLPWHRSDRCWWSVVDTKVKPIAISFVCTSVSLLIPTGAESLNRNSFSFSDERLNSPTVLSPATSSPPLVSPKRELCSSNAHTHGCHRNVFIMADIIQYKIKRMYLLL